MEKAPDIETIKKSVEGQTSFIDLVAEIWHSRNWVKRLALLDTLLFIGFNPYFKTVLRFVPDSWLPSRYELYFWLVISAIFLVALVIGIRAREAKKQTRTFAERSTIKGLLPFGFADREIFKQLERGTELTECCQAITDRNFRFGVLSGESGAGKTSFLQAGLWPALLEESRCVYVKFTDHDPASAIRQAFNEQKIVIPETTPADAPLSTLLADVAQSDAKPLVLLLDHFEQFFVHFKSESRRRPFIRELNEWYRNGRGLPIKILICIRGDFLYRLNELQKVLGYSLGPQQNFDLKKFRPEQAAAVFRVIADAEKLDCDDGFIKELTEQELAGADDGLISPVDIQILAWMIAGQTGHEERAFNRTTFQKQGGVEGLLERFLTRALEARETPARRQAATKLLLALTDLDRNARAGALTLDELRQKLGGALADAELKEAVEWLSRSDVRLIAPVKLEEVDGYELAHERLIPALRRIAGKELSEADRASLLLDRRFNEWTGNNRDRRHRLTWRELRSIKKQTPFMQWEPNRSGKESLIIASWRQIRLRLALASLPVLLVIVFASVWYSQWGQLHQVKWDVAEYSDEITDPDTLTQLVRTYAAMGNFSKALQFADKIGSDPFPIPFLIMTGRDDLKAEALLAIAEAYDKFEEKEKAAQLLNQALETIGNRAPKARTLPAIAEAYVRLGKKEKAVQLLNQALSLAEESGYENFKLSAIAAIANGYAREKEKVAQLLGRAFSLDEEFGNKASRANTLRAIVQASAKLGEKEKAAQLLNQALSLTEKFGNAYPQSYALPAIAEAYDRLGEKEKAAQLLSQALSHVEKIDYEPAKSYALLAIAKAYDRLGEKERAAQLLNQAFLLAEKISDEFFKAIVLQPIAEAYARLGDFRLARASALKIPSEANKAKAMALILEVWVRSRDPRLADEVSKDEE